VRSREFVRALLDGNARDAEGTVRAALADGVEPSAVHVAIIAPAMRTVGDLWARDAITVADEHLATALTYRALDAISAAGGAPGAPPRQRVMLAALQGERHVVGLQMVADTLAAADFDVLMLGPDVPLGALAAAVARHAPAVLGLSATMPAGPLLAEAIERVHAVDSVLPVLVGGAGAPHIAPARHVADAAAVVAAVEAAVGGR